MMSAQWGGGEKNTPICGQTVRKFCRQRGESTRGQSGEKMASVRDGLFAAISLL